MMRWSRALMLVLALLVACGGGKKVEAQAALPGASKGLAEAARDQNGRGGTLIIGMSAGNLPYPNTPPNEGFEGRRWVGYQIYDGLANWNLAQGDTVPVPTPALAEKWSVGEDKLTWTIHLRTGVKFHDGTDFNAEAVVFNMNRIMNREFEFFDPDLYVPNRVSTQEIASYRALDPYTVEVKTTVPYAFFPVSMAYILYASPTAVQKWGNKAYVNHPVGTGPF